MLFTPLAKEEDFELSSLYPEVILTNSMLC
uniref:Uncharacterized protein n=1 Tax=Rhizophora mucronata TaxID=61149 RepID=A0A2P2NLJ7_RHIMU